MKRCLCLLVAVSLVGAASCLSACHTVEGAGRDIQAIGKGTSDAARDTHDALTGKH